MPVLRIGGMVFLLERDVEAYLRAKYGRMLLRPRKPVGPPPLPKEVVESSLLKRGR
jgi:hypothetical protein